MYVYLIYFIEIIIIMFVEILSFLCEIYFIVLLNLYF